MSKRPRSRSPPPWRKREEPPQKSPRRDVGAAARRHGDSDGGGAGIASARSHARRNQAQENQHMRTWVNEEDAFVLKQSVKKAKIRIREGRAKPIDHLAVAVGALDSEADLLEEADVRPDFEIRNPRQVVEDVDSKDVSALKEDVERWLVLETRKTNRAYWKAIKTICKDRLEREKHSLRGGRGMGSVAADIDKVLAPKRFDELQALERTVKAKLDSNEPIDEEYWEQLLHSIGVFKARAELDNTFRSIVKALHQLNQRQNTAEAEREQKRCKTLAAGHVAGDLRDLEGKEPAPCSSFSLEATRLRAFVEHDFLAKIESDRKAVRRRPPPFAIAKNVGSTVLSSSAEVARIQPHSSEHSRATNALFDREAARGEDEGEEVFTAEEDVAPINAQQGSSASYRPRKPRYYNRVQMGFEWNKYNQTHYDADNPPPKVVQGYKFNVFYPELVDKSKAPTYRIERENGRRRGQTFAPAGEEDTCLIRFIAGAPYEDIAFRVVDREWDYSAKYDRGFKSSFDKGILQLHFQFKKVYYRK